MNLQGTIEIYGGGPGSGCNPEAGKCGRPATGQSEIETGKPFSVIGYRGEGAPAAWGRDRIPSQFAVGEYWSTRRDVAETYGPKVLSEKVNLRNPYVLNLGRKLPYFEELRREFGTMDAQKITDKLRGQGHDGLVVTGVPVNRFPKDEHGNFIFEKGVAVPDSIEVVKFK